MEFKKYHKWFFSGLYDQCTECYVFQAKQLAGMFGVDNVASVAYGIEGGSFNKDTQQLYKHGIETMNNTVDNPILLFLLFVFPNLASLLRLR